MDAEGQTRWYLDAVFTPIVLVLGIIGNCFIITILQRNRDCKKPKCNTKSFPKQRGRFSKQADNLFTSSSMYLYLLALAISDLGYLIGAMFCSMLILDVWGNAYKNLACTTNCFKGI